MHNFFLTAIFDMATLLRRSKVYTCDSFSVFCDNNFEKKWALCNLVCYFQARMMNVRIG